MSEHPTFTGEEHADQVTGWTKAQASMNNGACVEVGRTRDGTVAAATGEVAIRQSRDPQGLFLTFSAQALQEFVTGAKRGEFDGFLPGSEAEETDGGANLAERPMHE